VSIQDFVITVPDTTGAEGGHFIEGLGLVSKPGLGFRVWHSSPTSDAEVMVHFNLTADQARFLAERLVQAADANDKRHQVTA